MHGEKNGVCMCVEFVLDTYKVAPSSSACLNVLVLSY